MQIEGCKQILTVQKLLPTHTLLVSSSCRSINPSPLPGLNLLTTNCLRLAAVFVLNTSEGETTVENC